MVNNYYYRQSIDVDLDKQILCRMNKKNAYSIFSNHEEMGNFVKKIYLKYFYTFRYKLLSDKAFIKKKFKKTFKYELNLENPKTFTEKIQWLKLNNKDCLLTQCADKLAVRNYVKEKIGEKYLVPLIYYTNNVNDINLEKLPNFPVIIKTNNNSGGTIVVVDKNVCNFKEIQKKLKKALKTNFFYVGREWEYKNVKPCIIIEKLLKDDSNNDILNDYKVHCFNGIPQYIQTIFDRNIEMKENWYDTEWNLLNVYYFSSLKKQISKPKLLNKLIEIATILSKDFIYVRVDLYISQNKIYFGELTFRPYAGFMKFHPKEFDRILGEKLKLPIEK